MVEDQDSLHRRIQELEWEKQQLYGVVSHDIRGPLNRIFALIQLTQLSSGNLNQEQQEYLAKIHIMVADGLGMIRNLADCQKLESQLIELNPDTFNLSSVLAVLARNYKVLAEKKNIQLLEDIPPGLAVFSDRYYSTRIFDNLLANAIKFSVEHKRVFLRAKDEGAWVRVDIEDEGPGLSDADQNRLYKKFQTLSAKPTAGETATGIGLFVAKELADKTGAELFYKRCAGGGGTIFTVRIKKVK